MGDIINTDDHNQDVFSQKFIKARVSRLSYALDFFDR